MKKTFWTIKLYIPKGKTQQEVTDGIKAMLHQMDLGGGEFLAEWDSPKRTSEKKILGLYCTEAGPIKIERSDSCLIPTSQLQESSAFVADKLRSEISS